MKTWIGIGVVIGLALVIGLAAILFRNLSADFGDDAGMVLSNEQARRGYEVATAQGCIACHTLDGNPGIGPTWKGLYGRSVTLSDGTTVVADAAYIRESIVDPEEKVVDGFETLMLSYPLPEADLAALVEFTRQLAQP